MSTKVLSWYFGLVPVNHDISKRTLAMDVRKVRAYKLWLWETMFCCSHKYYQHSPQ